MLDLLSKTVWRPMTNSDTLKTELETHEDHKQELLASGEGKYVLIQGHHVVGVWDTYEDALKEGYEKFGVDTPFLVKPISGFEIIHSFTRDLTECRS